MIANPMSKEKVARMFAKNKEGISHALCGLPR